MNPKNQKINFIRHYLDINAMFQEDERITLFHTSLYFALFQEWNHANFKNPISISRNEMMRISKIGSSNTYTKTLKELHDFKYIEYQPSYNRFLASKVYLFIFDYSCDNSSDKGSDNGTDKAKEMVLRPYLNYNKLNKTLQNKETKKEIFEEKISISQPSNNDETLFSKEVDTKELQSSSSAKTKKTLHSFPTSLEEVQSYFLEKKYPSAEAEKFYNYFESNGWLVGGKAKMKNWNAAAKNWMLNSKKFSENNSSQPKANHLHVEQDKDYSIPL